MKSMKDNKYERWNWSYTWCKLCYCSCNSKRFTESIIFVRVIHHHLVNLTYKDCSRTMTKGFKWKYFYFVGYYFSSLTCEYFAPYLLADPEQKIRNRTSKSSILWIFRQSKFLHFLWHFSADFILDNHLNSGKNSESNEAKCGSHAFGALDISYPKKRWIMSEINFNYSN